jgi:hypothetical protein
MKSPAARILLAYCGCLLAPVLQAGAADPIAATPLAATDPVQIESTFIAKLHASALKGADVSSLLAGTSSPFQEPLAPSVLLARRTMAVCGWLQSDNQHGLAMKLAQSALKNLANMKETSDVDHEERLYWEALLEGRVLDQKVRAIVSLEAARKINPEDDRVLELEHEFSAALAEFGR